MTPAIVIALKDLRLMLRDRPGLVFTVVFPLVFGLFFGAIYADSARGEQAPIDLIVVDATGSDGRWSEQLEERIRQSGRIQTIAEESRDRATELVQSGIAPLLLEIPADFDEWFESMGAVEAGTPRLVLAPGSIGEPEIVQGIVSASLYEMFIASLADKDASERRREALMRVASAPDTAMERAVQLAAAASAIQSLGSIATGMTNGLGIGIEQLPTAGRAKPPNSFAITFPQAMMWAVLGCAATFAVGLVSERHAGTLTRLRAAPVSAAQILAGKGLACMSLAFVLSLLFVLLGRVLLGVQPVSYPLLIVALLAVSFAFSGIMMLLAVLGRSKTSPGQLAWAVILIMAITGGGMLPLFFMPEWLLAVSHFSPVKWGILAIEGGVWRGFSATEMALPLAVLIGIGVTGFVIGARAFMLSERLSAGS